MDQDGVMMPAWIDRVLALAPEGGVEQNLFRSILFFSLHGLLYNSAPPALTVSDVVAQVRRRVQAEYPAFEPTFSPELLDTAWPSELYAPRGLDAELLGSARSAAVRQASTADADAVPVAVSAGDDGDENALQAAGVAAGDSDPSSPTQTPFSWSPGERRNS
jgi:hypothetical protein